MMIVEQLSEHREQQALQSHHNHSTDATTSSQGTLAAAGTAPSTSGGETGKGQVVKTSATANPSTHYGVLVNTCVIRDLGAVGFEHVGAKGQEIIQAVISLAGYS